MAVYLVCEGPADGLDVRVLDLVIAQKLGRTVQIIPVGGDSSLGSVRRWLEERSRTQLPDGIWSDSQDRAYAIEDRNFRSAADIEERWQQTNQKQWIWRRHEIENYLLDSRLVARAFQEIKKVPIAQKFADNLPDTDIQALNLLQQLAKPMLEDYIGQPVCQQLNFYKGDTAKTNLSCPQHPPEFSPTPTSPYPGRAEWLNYLQHESQRLKHACSQVGNDVKFNPSNIEAEYNRLLAEANKPQFLEQQFLIDMRGHELLNALLTHIKQNVGIARLTYSVFLEELIKALDELYYPGFFTPDDFLELVDKLI
jgi:hypothetical protein